jgi:hypothetical protein
MTFESFVQGYKFGESKSSRKLKIFIRIKEYAYTFMTSCEFIKALLQVYNQECINITFREQGTNK